MKSQNKRMHCKISPRRACNSCGFTMKMSSRYHRLLIYDVKRTTKIDGMGPFKTAKKHRRINNSHMSPTCNEG